MKKTYTIATLGSHSSLQILKGAKDEGFPTLLITLAKRADFYRRFKFIDHVISVENFAEFPQLEKELLKQNVILIPHGSFVAYLGLEGNKNMKVPYFGNKKVLDWEADRNMQNDWLTAANICIPRQLKLGDKIEKPVIVKSFGAAGGSGYFVANNNTEFNKKVKSLGNKKYLIQEYVIGVPIYVHFFYSSLTKQMEMLSVDRRYETNVDALGRIPLTNQQAIEINPSFTVVGNSPLVLRESLMPDAFEMAENLVSASKKLIDDKGMFGPFCLETIVTEDQKFYVIEVSCRIVAGTNLFVDGSPYASLYYDEPMSTGRRIAREIKLAIKQKKLEQVVT